MDGMQWLGLKDCLSSIANTMAGLGCAGLVVFVGFAWHLLDVLRQIRDKTAEQPEAARPAPAPVTMIAQSCKVGQVVWVTRDSVLDVIRRSQASLAEYSEHYAAEKFKQVGDFLESLESEAKGEALEGEARAKGEALEGEAKGEAGPTEHLEPL